MRANPNGSVVRSSARTMSNSPEGCPKITSRYASRMVESSRSRAGSRRRSNASGIEIIMFAQLSSGGRTENLELTGNQKSSACMVTSTHVLRLGPNARPQAVVLLYERNEQYTIHDQAKHC